MAREQILTEAINLSTMELWNSLPDNIRQSPSRPVSWTIPPSDENASVLTESAAPSDPSDYKFTYLLTLQKKELKQYIISCKTVADALKITVLNTKTSSGFAP